MANAVAMTEADVGTLESRLYEVGDDLTIEIPYEVQKTSVKIRGFEQAETATAGAFSVTVTPGGPGVAPKTELTFHTGDMTEGDTVRVAYRRRVNSAKVATIRTNSTTAKGSLYAHWPVYSSGTDCTESSVKGYLHLYIPRVRVTALPGFESSYKSASTNSVTFSAIDPKLASMKMYDLFYEPLNEDGEIITENGGGTVSWN